jgi:hypothetical protein
LQSVDAYCGSHVCPAPEVSEGPVLGYCVPLPPGQNGFQASTLMAYPDNCNRAGRQLWWSSTRHKVAGTDVLMGDTQFADQRRVLADRARYVAAHSDQE